MKNLLIVILLMTVATTIFAQNATVSGQTFDKSTQEVLAYVSIIVQNSKDSTIITGSISDENGRFVLSNIPKGNYRFRASFVGYKNFEIPLLVGSLNSVYDLGKIVLELSTQQLDEIVVKGEKETVSSNLEKKTFAMADNVSQSGGSVLEAMRNLPGVTVSPEGKLILRGSENVLVLIDGKQSSLTGFGNQKGSANGWNGEVGLATGVGELNQRKANLPNIQDKYAWTPKLNPTLNLNYKSSKVNWFFQGDGIVRRRINNNTFTTRTYSDGIRKATLRKIGVYFAPRADAKSGNYR